jgi:hypothetical protein
VKDVRARGRDSAGAQHHREGENNDETHRRDVVDAKIRRSLGRGRVTWILLIGQSRNGRTTSRTINVQVTASSKALCIEDTHGATNVIREPPDDGGEDKESDI